MAGRNGSVTAISSNSTSTGYKVHYPADPGGPGTPPDPPPQAEHDDTYYDVPTESAKSLRDAMNFGHKVDATGTNGSDGGTVTVHK